jgi:RNA polymerase sigma-70 factor (ECF subfamily)
MLMESGMHAAYDRARARPNLVDAPYRSRRRPGREDNPVSDRHELSAESSIELVRRAHRGDERALEQLFRRYQPLLRRWAGGRLPSWARDLLDTEDIVQETLHKTFRRLEKFEPRGDGGLQVYMRRALRNRIVDEIRRAGRHPRQVELDPGAVDPTASPLERAIGRQAVDSYERALERLSQADREAIVARVELGLGYDEMARALGKASKDGARMAVSRALVRLAREMGDAES